MKTGRLGLCWIVLAGAVGVGLAKGDVIELRDGRHISGSIRREGDRTMMITTEQGVKMEVGRDDVLRVNLVGTMSPAERLRAELTTTGVQIRKAGTIEEVVGICERFAKAHPDETAAQEMLASYRKLAATDAVKFQGKWMPREQMKTMKQIDADKGREAIEVYKSGNIRAALEMANGLLKQDEGSATALTVAGLAAFRLNDMNGAKDFFSRLGESDPTDVLALNNAAVICFLQGRQAEGMAWYGRALGAKPGNMMLLDNVMEAMHGYSGSHDAAGYIAVMRLMDQAEARAEAEMGAKGLVRYGSTWVDQATLARLSTEKQVLLNSMAAIEAQYRQELAGELAEERQLLETMANSGWGFQGGYYDAYVREARGRLDLVLQSLSGQQATVKEQLKGIEKKEFTGVQRMMELEGLRVDQ